MIDHDPRPAFADSELATFDVYLNGAFFVGSALHGDRIIAEGFRGAQQRVLAALDVVDRGSWSFCPVTQKDGRWFSGREIYASLIPLSFMSYRGEMLPQHVRATLDAISGLTPTGSITWSLEDATVEFHESGVGVLSMHLHATGKRAVALSEARGAAEALVNDLVEPCNEAISDIAGTFVAACRDALPEFVVNVAWCQDDGIVDQGPYKGVPDDRLGLTSPKSLLWLHVTYIVDAGGRDMHFDTACEALLPSIFERLPMRDFTFMPGIGASIIIRRHNEAAPKGILDFRLVLTLMNLQWAVIAIAMEADRTLFRRLNVFAASGQSASATKLELETRSVLSLYDRTRLYRSSLDTVLIDLGRGAHGAWDAMARVQGLPGVLASIQDKLDALNQACQSQLAHASTKRQRRLGIAVDFFTTFGVVASVAAVATFLLDSQLKSGTVVRIAIITAAVGLVLAVATLARLGGRRR